MSSKAEHFKTLFDNFQKSGNTAINAQLQTSGLSLPSNSSNSANTQDLGLLKLYIDSKFKDLEDKLCRKIDESTKQQEAKLDQILELLTSSN